MPTINKTKTKTKTKAKRQAAPRPATPATPASAAGSASRRIDDRIADLGDWRGEMLARLRKLVQQAEPAVVETWKWRGVPVWEHYGIVCTGETHKSVVKTTFAKGAYLPDPGGLFNASLEGSTRRAIDFREGDKINDKAFKALVRAAAALNESMTAQRSRKKV
jgi:hypothetical protein